MPLYTFLFIKLFQSLYKDTCCECLPKLCVAMLNSHRVSIEAVQEEFRTLENELNELKEMMSSKISEGIILGEDLVVQLKIFIPVSMTAVGVVGTTCICMPRSQAFMSEANVCTSQ